MHNWLKILMVHEDLGPQNGLKILFGASADFESWPNIRRKPRARFIIPIIYAGEHILIRAWGYHIIILSYYHIIIISYYHIIILSYYHIIILSYYHVIILSYCNVIILSCSHINILSYHQNIILTCYHIIIMS